MDIGDIQSKVIEYLKEEIGIDAGIAEDDPLFSTGTVDSFDLVRILSFLKEQYGLELSPLEVSLDNLDSVARISELVSKRVG
jgi:acyl carrier protein